MNTIKIQTNCEDWFIAVYALQAGLLFHVDVRNRFAVAVPPATINP